MASHTPSTLVKRFSAVFTLAFLICVSPASADFQFGSTGSGAGQFSNPQSIAVDQSNGHLYVADKGNNRVDIFDSSGNFLSAFGWGVADGTGAEPQVCASTCFAGLEGGGAGEFSELRDIAVDNDPASSSYHDIYTFDGYRVQKFSPTGEFLRAWGGGVVTGGAKGSGDLSSGSTTITNVKTTQKAFEVGQTITGAGIPAETRIAALGPGTITLSKAATGSGVSVAISVAEGAGNVPVNEVQIFENIEGLGGGTVRFETNNPSPSDFATQSLPANSTAAEIQAALSALPNIGPGNVVVTGAAGGPWAVEFKGSRYSDTNVPNLRSSGGFQPSIAVQNGGSGTESCATAITDCAGGAPGSGFGQFDKASDYLVVGPGGAVYVASGETGKFVNNITPYTNRLQLFDASGAFSEQFEVASGPGKRLEGLAVDSSGNAYVSAAELHKYDPGGNEVATLHPDTDSGQTEGAKAVALAPAGDIFVGANGPTVEYNASGILQRVLYTSSVARAYAPYESAGGDLFVLQNNKVLYATIPPPGPLFTPFGTTASPVGNLTATLHSSFNPEGKATTYHFEYVDDADFQNGGFANPATKTTAESAPGSADFKLQEANLTAGGLIPDTTYHFRAVATNADGTASGPEATFKTRPPIEAVDAWSTEVGAESAILHASVDPRGIAAAGYLQYVDEASFQQSGFAEAADLPDVAHGALPFDFGAGVGPSARTAILSSLPSGTSYRFRLVAEDPYGTFSSPTRRFSTPPLPEAPSGDCENEALRGGASAGLPDCRAYELISPVDKGGGDVLARRGLAYIARMDQSTPSGGRLTYSSASAFGDVASAPLSSQYIATRDPGSGWGNEAISPAQEGEQFAVFAQIENAYRIFSTDLESAWLQTNSEPLLAPGAQPGYQNFYRRDNAKGAYGACTTTEPNVGPLFYSPQLQAAAADGTHAVLQAKARLTFDASNAKNGPNPILQVYECTVEGGETDGLRLVSVLPDGKASAINSTAGTTHDFVANDHGRTGTMQGAVSADGERVFWTASTGIDGIGPGSLYVRVNATQPQSTVEGGKCSEATAACTYRVSAGSQGGFWAGAPDGSKALFIEGPEGGTGDLYGFDTEKAIAGEEGRALIAHGAFGVLGTSRDLSRFYFLSTEQIGGQGIAGEPNLYRYEADGNYAYVATLSAQDATAVNTKLSPIQPEPISHTALANGDGEQLAFMSSSPGLAEAVAGYDNTDRQSGEADAEIYRYDAGSGQLSCVSCNRSGGRPSGRDLRPRSNAPGTWAAARLPTWENSTYATRALSEDGKRIFFESYEPLVLSDTNGAADVYEWEAPDSGSCREAGGAFVKPAAGCVYLVSSGKSSSDSEFIDASADGSDVFIRTAQSLLPQDPGQVDIYDARVGGGFPAPPSPREECEGEACQGAFSPPNDPTPASSTYVGSESQSEEGGKPTRCRRGKIHRTGRCVAKNRHPKKAHPRRAGKGRRAGR